MYAGVRLSDQRGVAIKHVPRDTVHIYTYLQLSTCLRTYITTHYLQISTHIYIYLRIYAGAAVVLGAGGERAAGDLPAETRGPHAARHQVSRDWWRAVT